LDSVHAKRPTTWISVTRTKVSRSSLEGKAGKGKKNRECGGGQNGRGLGTLRSEARGELLMGGTNGPEIKQRKGVRGHHGPMPETQKGTRGTGRRNT